MYSTARRLLEHEEALFLATSISEPKTRFTRKRFTMKKAFRFLAWVNLQRQCAMAVEILRHVLQVICHFPQGYLVIRVQHYLRLGLLVSRDFPCLSNPHIA